MTYTAEEVREMEVNVRDCAWPPDVKEYMTLIEPMLHAYAADLEQREAGVTADIVKRAAQSLDDSMARAGSSGSDDMDWGEFKDAVRIALLAVWPVAAEPVAQSAERNAYEGAREDLLDWKHRALSAESTLRSLGYKGLCASEPPTEPARPTGVAGGIANGRRTGDNAGYRAVTSTGEFSGVGVGGVGGEWIAAGGNAGMQAEQMFRYVIAAAPPAGVPEGWRPIETAPDDEPFLAWNGDYLTIAMNNTRVGKCVDFCDNPCWDEEPPTHWMPLPAAPQPGEPNITQESQSNG